MDLIDLKMKTGFRNWKHAMGKTGVISAHAKCETHKHAGMTIPLTHKGRQL